MILRKSPYFDDFHCIASACPDSCCAEWEVQVDADTAAAYLALEGPLGDRLRQVLRQEGGEYTITIQDGRCPMWREDGLCRIQAELGEGSLCKTCREFPRLTHDYGNFQERVLELSCPEAAGLILSDPGLPMAELQIPGGLPGDYDGEAMEILLTTRRRMLALLSDRNRPVGEVLALALLYGCQAQSELDGGAPEEFDPEAALEAAAALAKGGDPGAVMAFFTELEILTDRWKERLAHPDPGPWEPAHLALARYFVQRYWLQAVSDYDLYSRVKLMVISCLLVRQLGGDVTATAQLYSKEIENSAANVDALLDGAYDCPAFTDDKLLSLLLAAP